MLIRLFLGGIYRKVYLEDASVLIFRAMYGRASNSWWRARPTWYTPCCSQSTHMCCQRACTASRATNGKFHMSCPVLTLSSRPAGKSPPWSFNHWLLSVRNVGVSPLPTDQMSVSSITVLPRVAFKRGETGYPEAKSCSGWVELPVVPAFSSLAHAPGWCGYAGGSSDSWRIPGHGWHWSPQNWH